MKLASTVRSKGADGVVAGVSYSINGRGMEEGEEKKKKIRNQNYNIKKLLKLHNKLTKKIQKISKKKKKKDSKETV